MFERPAVQAFIALAHKRSYAPKQAVVRAGAEPESLFLILTGSVSVLVEDEHGREMVLAYLNAGEFFGEMGLFPDQQVRTAVVRTRTATLLAEVSYSAFRSFVREHPEIMFEVAGQLAARLRDTSGRLRDLTFVDVAGRLARALLDLTRQPDAKQHARGILVRISRQEIARFIGCSREMAGRVLKKLQVDGVLHARGKTVVLYGTR